MKVSFTIPTLNRGNALEACLRSIREQDYPETEIIIVDGGSKDSTLDIAAKYGSKIVHDSGPLGQARQVGFENSTGSIIGVFDSDIIIPFLGWLTHAVEKFSEGPDIGIVAPSLRPPKNASLTARCYNALWLRRRFVAKSEAHVPGGNSLILRDAIQEAGGFNRNLRFGEDVDLCDRILKLSYTTAFFDEPLVHDTMCSLKEYTRKQVWGASSLAGTRDTHVTNLAISLHELPPAKSRLGYSALQALELAMTGFRGMIDGLGKQRDYSWVMFPILLAIRVLVYTGYFAARGLKG